MATDLDSLLRELKLSNGEVPIPEPTAKVGKPPLLDVSDIKIKLIKALREVPGLTLGLKEAKDVVEAFVAEYNALRQPDPAGTLRKARYEGRFAFAIAEGDYLLIDTQPVPRAKAATRSEAVEVRNWPVVVRGGSA